jgi:hypothetical protein
MKRRGEPIPRGDVDDPDDGREARCLMHVPWDEAKALQRPLSNGALKIIRRGADKEDIV